MISVEALCSSCGVPEWLFKVMFWLGYCNSLMNPIIYSCASQDFQLAFIRLLRCRCRARRRPVTPLAAGPRYLCHDSPAVYLRRPGFDSPGRLIAPSPDRTQPGRLSTRRQRDHDDNDQACAAHPTQSLRGGSEGSFGRRRVRSSLVDRNRTRYAGPKSDHQKTKETERVWTSMHSRQVTML